MSIPVPRHDFFQTPTHITLSLYIKGYAGTPVVPSYSMHSVQITLPDTDSPGGTFSIGPLAGGIIPDRSEMRVLGTKIELKLAKDDPGAHWPALLATSPADHTRPSTPITPSGTSTPRDYFPPLTREANTLAVPGQSAASSSTLPIASGSALASASTSAAASGSSRPKPKNWDKLVDEMDDEPEGEGDAALQKLFSSIYGNADEDTRRAMIKSFTESGGTTLSTDWGSVGKDKVPVRPPDGMYEMKM